MLSLYFFFFFNDTATTEIYTLSLHDALPISAARKSFIRKKSSGTQTSARSAITTSASRPESVDRKSTRLNSSHGYISYAVFCLKKKKKNQQAGRQNASAAGLNALPHTHDNAA